MNTGEQTSKNIFTYIKYKDINIKQHPKVTYLGWVLDETISGESMTSKVINKINSKLKFLYRKIRFLSAERRTMLFSALIQPHFDYACPARYSNRTGKTEKKKQIMQNKCIRFCKDWTKCITYLKSILD